MGIEEEMGAYASVTDEDVTRVANDVFDRARMSIAIHGPSS